MTEEELAPIRSRLEAATRGPWHWDVNSISKNICLENSRDIVMDFVRYGTQCAAPRFNVDGVMERADTLAKSIPGKEHHKGFDDYIDHPDAEFIAHAPDDMRKLLSVLEKAAAKAETLEKAIYGNCYYCKHLETHVVSTDGGFWSKQSYEKCAIEPQCNWQFNEAGFAKDGV